MSNIKTPKIFKTKNKENTNILSEDSKVRKDKSTTVLNYMFKSKHFTPYITEWVNSVYSYNKNTIKLLPSLDVGAYSLIRSYFNLYIIKHNNKTRAKRWRVRTTKSTTKRLIAAKPSMKHTNDKVNITIYTFDRSSTHYITKIADMLSLDQLKGGYSAFFANLKSKYLLLEDRLEHKLKNKYFKGYLRNIIINKYKPFFFNITENYNKNLTRNKANFLMKNKFKMKSPLFLHFLKKELTGDFPEYLNNYIKKVMWDEIVSICYQQCISFEQSKYEKQHIRLLTTLLENLYNKKVLLDIVNLKYFYNSSSIFSNIVLTKLKMKKNKVINVLGLILDRFEIPPIDRIKIYEETYNRKRFKQNAILKNLLLDTSSESQKVKYIRSNDTMDTLGTSDTIDTTLCKYSGLYSSIDPLNDKELQLNASDLNLYKIIGSLKNKFTKGIRIEVAGRLTKRNTAERSIFKLRYKGNIRNIDSSMKNLPTALLRGHAKSNLVYVQSKSRLRIGAFGIKTWVSSD